MTPVLSLLARLDPDQVDLRPGPAAEKGATLVAGEITIFLPLGGMVDVEAEIGAAAKATGRDRKTPAGQQKAGWATRNSSANAPANVVEQARQTLADLQSQRDKLAEQIEALS